MKADEINVEELIAAYNELKSSYKVAKKFNVSATAIKRILKKLGVLRTQSLAAKERDESNFSYKREERHIKKLSELGKAKIKEKNPFYGKKHKKETKEKIGQSTKKRVGERNPNYRHGEYQRRPRDFKIAEFTRLRNFVFNRDDHTCNYCKLMGGHLHAHHKIPFWVCKDAFLDVDNLITVCTKCHFELAHKNNWASFDITLIDERLLKKYNLDRERLNDLANPKKIRCDSPTSDDK